MSEHTAEIDALLRDLRNPMIDVAESNAALIKALAQAWEDGYDAGHTDARAVQATYPEPTPNPYRTRVIPPGRWDEDADALFVDKAREATREQDQP